MVSTIAQHWFVFYFTISAHAFNFQFNTSSFESCDLNIVKSNFSQITMDLIETILLIRHANLHRISNLSPLSYGTPGEAITKPNAIIYGKCSVNILVQARGSSKQNLKRIFGSRIFSANNIFLIIAADPMRYNMLL